MFERMAAFRSSFGEPVNKTTTAEYYRWKAEENPFGRGTVHLVEREGVVAGSASITFKPVLVNGEVVKAAEIGDTYTNPDFRRQGIFSTAVRHCTEFAMDSGASFIYGTPNDASLPGYEQKMNYRQVPGAQIAILTKYLSAGAVASRVARRVPIAPLATALAHGYLAAGAVRSAVLGGSAAGITVEAAAEFPPCDGRWGESRRDFAFFTVRDREYLTWRFQDNPDSYEILVARRGGAPVGFLVTKSFRRDGEKVGAICDFASQDDEHDIFVALERAAERRLGAEGAAYAETWCAASSPYLGWFRELGYVQRSAMPVIVYAGSPAAGALLNEKGRWHFTRADSDNI